MDNLVPEKPDLNINISAQNIYEVLADTLKHDRYKMLLYKLYEKLTSLHTKTQELKGKLMQKEEEIEELNDALERWEDGQVNFLHNQFVAGERDEIMDAFFIMINEKPTEAVDHVKSARDRLEKSLGIHKNAAASLANFMNDMLSTVEDKMIPDDDFVYLDTSKLSEEERNKIKRMHIESGEVLEINDKAIRLNPSDLHIEGNQVLIDPKKMDPRERKALAGSLDPDEGSNSSVSLPARALTQTGDAVDEQNIRRFQSFPEENPDRDVEEANPEDYGEGNQTGSQEKLDDDLPF